MHPTLGCLLDRLRADIANFKTSYEYYLAYFLFYTIRITHSLTFQSVRCLCEAVVKVLAVLQACSLVIHSCRIVERYRLFNRATFVFFTSLGCTYYVH